MSNCRLTKYVCINGWTFRVDTTLCDVIDAEISNIKQNTYFYIIKGTQVSYKIDYTTKINK